MASFSTSGDFPRRPDVEQLCEENQELRARLTEVEDTLRAIREGEVDAVVVTGSQGDRVFTLSEGENLHRLMVETMDEAGFATSPEGLLVFCNHRACALLGRSHDQLVGHDLREFVSPAGAEAYEDLLAAAQDEKADARVEFQDVTGSAVPMHVWANRLERSDGPLLCLVATDLRRLEVHRDLIALAEASSEFVGISDANLKPVFLNAAGQRMVGLDGSEDLEGVSVLDFFFPEDRAFIRDSFFEDVMRAGAAEVESRFRHFKSGESIWVIYSVVALTDAKGHLTGFGTVTRNITQMKVAQKELEQSHVELEKRVALRTVELRQRADQLSRLTSELTLTEQRERRRLAQILHDHLQQILVAAKMNLDVSTSDLPQSAKKAFYRVGALIDDAVRASRSLTVELSPPILHEAGLSAGLRWLARWMKDNHGLEVRLQLEEDADPEREDVRILVFESVRELLFNVVKHAGVWEASISLSRNGSADIVLTVEDGGKGFDSEAMMKRDAQNDQGFGLFSIEERLSLLGGSLDCRSRPGAGATFSLYAPLTGARLASSDEQTLQKVPEPISSHLVDEPAAVEDAEAPIRVLLVDDHELVREGLRILIAAAPGMVVAGEASDGEEGVRKTLALKPHVVLMDYSLPLLDGVAATRRIHEQLPEIPVIGLSMYDEPDRASAMLEAGAVAYLCKSGQSSGVVDRIREVCRRQAECV